MTIGFQAKAQIFEVSFDSKLTKEQFSGNILLYLSKENRSPKDIFVGLDLSPVYRITVKNLKPNETATFDDRAISYPVELSNIERGEYYVQAVFDLNEGDANIGTSVGNLYSKPIRVNLTKDFGKTFKLKASERIAPLPFKETENLKELSVRSKLLSDFHKKEMFINAAVKLPEEYNKEPNRRFPVVYAISGFDGNYKIDAKSGRYDFIHLGKQPTIVVFLDGRCSEGHSTYANSDVNGPWGDALVNEFIPALNKKYRTNNANLLLGHSSGGWASLWLQINYPKVFAGAWASSPDPVDFRNYEDANIYEADNLFYDKNGRLLTDISISGMIPVASVKDIYRQENVIYRGGQLHSFEAVFGGYDANGNIIRLIKLPTGEINKEALPLFKRYDLSILLRNNWDTLKKDLDKKIRISVGNNDNFFLNSSVELLEQEMKKINASIEFGYYPGDHFTVISREYIEDGLNFLVKSYENWLNHNK